MLLLFTISYIYNIYYVWNIYTDREIFAKCNPQTKKEKNKKTQKVTDLDVKIETHQTFDGTPCC